MDVRVWSVCECVCVHVCPYGDRNVYIRLLSDNGRRDSGASGEAAAPYSSGGLAADSSPAHCTGAHVMGSDLPMPAGAQPFCGRLVKPGRGEEEAGTISSRAHLFSLTDRTERKRRLQPFLHALQGSCPLTSSVSNSPSSPFIHPAAWTGTERKEVPDSDTRCCAHPLGMKQG